LLKSYDKDVKWDTECIFKKLGADDLKAIIDSKKRQIADANQSIGRYQQQIASIVEHGSPVAVPVLAKNRGCEHFNIGDAVYVFHLNRWNRGIVQNGYRHHDGCVSYSLIGFPETVETPWGCGNAVPSVLLLSEMNWFLNNNESIFNDWLNLQNQKYNGTVLPLQEYNNAFLRLKQCF